MKAGGLTFRVGRHVPYIIYIQLGPRPSGEDVFLGCCRTAGMAAQLVRYANVGYEVVADGGAGALLDTVRAVTE